MIQVLNLSGSDTEYSSKAFSTEGKLLSIIPEEAQSYSVSDTLELQNPDSFDTGVAPSVNGSLFPNDKLFLAGEYQGDFMLFDEDSITGYGMISTGQYKYAPIYFQEDNGHLYMAHTSLSQPVLSIVPSIDGKAYWSINTTDIIEMLTVSGDLKIDGTLSLNYPYGIFTSDTSASNLFDFLGVTNYILINELTFTFSGSVTQNIAIIGLMLLKQINYSKYNFMHHQEKLIQNMIPL